MSMVVRKKCLPTGHGLIKLAREYTEKEWCRIGETLGYEYMVLEERNFMKIVKWLSEQGY